MAVIDLAETSSVLWILYWLFTFKLSSRYAFGKCPLFHMKPSSSSRSYCWFFPVVQLRFRRRTTWQSTSEQIYFIWTFPSIRRASQRVTFEEWSQIGWIKGLEMRTNANQSDQTWPKQNEIKRSMTRQRIYRRPGIGDKGAELCHIDRCRIGKQLVCR